MKLRLLFSTILFTAVVSIVSTGFQDCYGTWANSFDMAYEVHEADMAMCATRVVPELCYWEVEAAYNRSVNAAGTAYHCCVMGC